MTKLVLYETRQRIAYITLNRPDARNALDDGLNHALAEAWVRFSEDSDADVAILSANGKAFSAGADLQSFIPRWERASSADLRNNAREGLGGGITRGRHRLYKPIIAALHGYAVGAGFELALACDIRIASDDAVLGVFEVKVGLHQGDGGIVRLVNIAGVGVALDLTLTGRPVPAEEALRLGLVSRIVPRAELLEVAEDVAKSIIGNSQFAVRSAKETIMDVVGRQLDDALHLEALHGYSSYGDFNVVKSRIAQLKASSTRSRD
ncbi:enoyl-CoA hydratase/isomerase family protein [Mangrovitalea sediminis]|uniref:enoyl-CoA hydratase/isomerase family protein n=1 Tax=Mangrovitalea sediminis TaxID=1982043 RepID=UPI000BE62832|nr:enoyl-CoA hydratase/isomerase family protein [Mangrovitalea sediminis]